MGMYLQINTALHDHKIFFPYGKHCQVKDQIIFCKIVEHISKQQDGTIVYNVSYNDNKNISIFGLRVGKFDKGIVIDDYIFYDYEIYFTTYRQDFEFIFILKDESKIVIRDKRAVRFFKEMFK